MKAKQKGQACQDVFAYSIVGDNGTYVEIGAYKPINKSNTYRLEVEYGWKGFSIELNQQYQTDWEDCVERRNKIFWENAITFDYASAIKTLKLPNRINYLSCDIEPPANTFAALKSVIEQGLVFDCITFEHDNYARQNKDDPDYDIIVREYLTSKGYKVAVTDVYAGKNRDALFETWFVNNDIDFPEMTYMDWRKLAGFDQ